MRRPRRQAEAAAGGPGPAEDETFAVGDVDDVAFSAWTANLLVFPPHRHHRRNSPPKTSWRFPAARRAMSALDG